MSKAARKHWAVVLLIIGLAFFHGAVYFSSFPENAGDTWANLLGFDSLVAFLAAFGLAEDA